MLQVYLAAGSGGFRVRIRTRYWEQYRVHVVVTYRSDRYYVVVFRGCGGFGQK